MSQCLRDFVDGVARRALIAAGAFVMGFAGVPQAGAAESLQTYFYLVFSNPTEGQESEYNRWYDAQHVPDVLSVAGFVSAERFRLNDVQMYPGVRVAMPRYLVSYIIRTNDVDSVMNEVTRRLQTGETVISPAFERRTSLAYLYLSWYDEVHAPSMMYTRAQRAVLAQPARFASIEPSDAIAMFRLSLPANVTIDKAREVPPRDAVPAPEILDLTRNRGYSYRRITPVVLAAPIQAERAARKKAKTEGTPKPALIARSEIAASGCAELFERIAGRRETSADAQDALMEEVEESGCFE